MPGHKVLRVPPPALRGVTAMSRTRTTSGLRKVYGLSFRRAALRIRIALPSRSDICSPLKLGSALWLI